MKFFDCNVMIGQTIVPTPNAIPNSKTLLDEMDRLEIDRALFFHYSSLEEMEQKNDMNRLTLEAARQSDRIAQSLWIQRAARKSLSRLSDHPKP